MKHKPTGKHWPSRKALTDYYRKEGYDLGFSTCLSCGHTDQSATDPKADKGRLQCSKCGSMLSDWLWDQEAMKFKH